MTGPRRLAAWAAVAAAVAVAAAGVAWARRPSPAALGCNAAGPAPSSREVDAAVGLDAHLFWSDKRIMRSELARAARGGVGWVREDFDWATVEPAAGRFNWARPDCLMAAASAAGLHVLAILDYSAPWDTSDPSRQRAATFPPRQLDAYAAYARAVVLRYGPDGQFWRGHPGVPLTAVEVWNEPNAWWSWHPDPDPAAYAAMVRQVAGAVHASAPAVAVLACGDLNQVRRKGSAPWLSALLDADPSLGSVVDGWSVHPYPSRRSAGPDDRSGPPDGGFDRVVRIHDLVVARGADRPVWITEIGWTTAHNGDGVTEATQARYVGRALERGLGEWRGFVARVFVYSWDRSTGRLDDTEGNFGLRRADDTTKPAWAVVSQFARLHAAPAG